MKKLLFGASALTLAGFLLAGCSDDSSTEQAKETEKQAVSDNTSEADAPSTTDDKKATSAFAKDIKAVEGKALEDKAKYILKTYPKDTTKQSDVMEAFAIASKGDIQKKDYDQAILNSLQDYQLGGYIDLSDRATSLMKIYTARTAFDYAEAQKEADTKEVTAFAKSYKTLLQDYYRGLDQKDSTKETVQADTEKVEKTYFDLPDSLKGQLENE